MAAFNPADYETVAERIKRFYVDFPDGRITTRNLTQQHDRAISTWVVQAYVFLTAKDQLENCPKATGLAFEVDGTKGANLTSALENAETSSIGRALASAGYSGDKRASREEMNKVNRGVTPSRNWNAALDNIDDLEGLRSLYLEATQAKANKQILDQIKAKADGLSGDNSKH